MINLMMNWWLRVQKLKNKNNKEKIEKKKNNILCQIWRTGMLTSSRPTLLLEVMLDLMLKPDLIKDWRMNRKLSKLSKMKTHNLSRNLLKQWTLLKKWLKNLTELMEFMSHHHLQTTWLKKPKKFFHITKTFMRNS